MHVFCWLEGAEQTVSLRYKAQLAAVWHYETNLLPRSVFTFLVLFTEGIYLSSVQVPDTHSYNFEIEIKRLRAAMIKRLRPVFMHQTPPPQANQCGP